MQERLVKLAQIVLEVGGRWLVWIKFVFIFVHHNTFCNQTQSNLYFLFIS